MNSMTSRKRELLTQSTQSLINSLCSGLHSLLVSIKKFSKQMALKALRALKVNIRCNSLEGKCDNHIED